MICTIESQAMNNELTHPVIFFDGICNLCCGAVQFIIKHDKKKTFRFAALQSHFARQLLQGIEENRARRSDSIILLYREKLYQQSTAVFMIAKHLNGLYPLLYCLLIVPAFIRNNGYSFIAKHRYRWFGKRNECWLPTKELSGLFYE
jgi:Uncharacterized protein conserved in bacteria